MEISDLIESHERVEIRKQKQVAVNNQILSDQIMRGINLIINGSEKTNEDTQFKQLWDYYPDLFEDEKKQYYMEKQESEFEVFKNRRKRFASQYNKKYKGDGD
ncbi:hypothetical protein [Candidatus Stoquefichus massiliensis]|uniref:hypothetical protein n=1 Tax=Candidatus Stoquefichus massiliensis TaxID=1470350 RepID=UPI0004AD29DE|nr:hypothetical protein [Candidatus Stoquefichus massiliensis]